MTARHKSPVVDPFEAGRASGWKIIDASMLERDLVLEADVAIVGSGAGGGTTAEVLAERGLNVVLLEEGPLATSGDFEMRESDAYPQLYQESAARKTRDKAINILQGRCVGGGTTVNWTSSFRTPPATLAWWHREFGLNGFSVEDLAPWFARMEARLSIGPWNFPPNANNDALARGATRLGIPSAAIRRNATGCANLGYCGMGCPINAKQSMLVTTVPGALAKGATLVTRLRAQQYVWNGDRVQALEGAAMDAAGIAPTARNVTVRARAFVCAAGAIGTPALLLRSRVPDPNAILGKRTFLHPTVVSAALMEGRVDGFSGAPQTIYTDHFLETQPIDGPLGYKLEAPPLHPVLTAITLPEDGVAHARWMKDFPRMQVLIALLRDGFNPESQGGDVRLRDDGTPLLDYPLRPVFWEGARRALVTMAEIQFAAGAEMVMPVHAAGAAFTNIDKARAAIASFDLKPLVTSVVSAHVMGGAPFGPDARRAVVDPTGRHHQLANLYVFDGSLFPTSIGANPQLSIYGIAARLAAGLAHELRPSG
ncbi:MAG TPA: GMC family oxidoreductase [Casimicrobiaceae bacterium]